MKKILPFLIGLVIIVAFISKIGFGEIVSLISKSDKLLVLLSIIVLAVSIGVKNLRWAVLLSAISKITKMEASMIYFAGQLTNEILPTGSGELVRAHFVKRLEESSYGKPLGALMIERALDVFLLLLIATVGIQTMFFTVSSFNFAIAISFLFVLSAALLFIRHSLFTGAVSIFQKIGFGFFASISTKILGAAQSFEESINAYKNGKMLHFAFIATVIAWFVEAVAQLIMLKAFYYSVTFPQILGVVGLSWIIGTFSFIPGGLGAREATFAYLLYGLGVPLSASLSAGLLYRACIYLQFGVLGGVSFIRLTKQLALQRI